MRRSATLQAFLIRIVALVLVGVTGFVASSHQPSNALAFFQWRGECTGCVEATPSCLAETLSADGSSPGGSRPAVVCQPLVLLRLPALPTSPGTIEVARIALAADTPADLAAVAGPMVLYVEHGTAIVEWEMAAPAPEIRRGLLGVTPPVAAPVTDPGHAAALIERWDWLALAPGFPHVLVGQSSAQSKILRVAITAAEPSATPDGFEAAAFPARLSQIWTPLAEGTFPLLPPTPALLAVGRISYDPVAADARLIQNFGPLLTTIESGTFGYLVAAGESMVVRAGSGHGEPVLPGVQITLESGDFVVEQPGVISGLRNLDPSRSFVLMVGLSPVASAAG